MFVKVQCFALQMQWFGFYNTNFVRAGVDIFSLKKKTFASVPIAENVFRRDVLVVILRQHGQQR